MTSLAITTNKDVIMEDQRDETHAVGSGRWRVPAGSLVIDASLVIMLVYSAGTMTNSLENIDKRVAALEMREITPEAARRISVIEEQIRRGTEDRQEMKEQLARIEQKIDAYIVNGNGRK